MFTQLCVGPSERLSSARPEKKRSQEMSGAKMGPGRTC
jgi:hypothetical protein